MDEVRLGRVLRMLRRRLGLRQVDLARRARISQSTISWIERGHADGLSIRGLRRILRTVDADLVVTVRWRGGELDRLLDERHASLGSQIINLLSAWGWTALPEVSFSIYGERGSIDILAWHPMTRTLLVIELKSELTSIEETLRRHDVKVRLAARIARERFGWQVGTVARLLVLPDQRTARSHVERHAGLLSKAYPARTVAVRRWLRAPDGSLAGILFLPNSDHVRGMRRSPGASRVRKASGSSGGA